MIALLAVGILSPFCEMLVYAFAGGEGVAVGLVHNVWWMEPKESGLMYKHIE